MNNSYPEKPCPCGRHCLNHGPSWKTERGSTSTTKSGRDVPLALAVLLVGIVVLSPLFFVQLDKANYRLRESEGIVAMYYGRLHHIKTTEADLEDEKYRFSGFADDERKTRWERWSIDLNRERASLQALLQALLPNAESKAEQARAEFHRLQIKEFTEIAVVLGFFIPFCFTRFLRGYVPWKWHCGRPMRVLITKTIHRAVNQCEKCGRENRSKWTDTDISRLCTCCGYTKIDLS